MHKTLSAAVLVLALCCPAAAGIMHNPAPQPTPTPASAVEEPADDATPDGVVHTPGLSDSLTEIALDLLAVLPSLL